MAKHTLSLSDDETAAVEWIVAHDAEPTIPDVDTWLYLKVRGEVRAAQTGYGLARKDAIIERVETGDQTKSVTEVLADVKETLKTPREKGDGKRDVDAVVTP